MVKEIVAFSNEALAQNSVLNKGIFYPRDYFDKLKDTGNVKRLEFMKARYHFAHGYLSPKLFDMMDSQISPTGKHWKSLLGCMDITINKALARRREGLSSDGLR